jgi:hypothetical protein
MPANKPKYQREYMRKYRQHRKLMHSSLIIRKFTDDLESIVKAYEDPEFLREEYEKIPEEEHKRIKALWELLGNRGEN